VSGREAGDHVAHLRRARDVIELTELMSRYTRAVDSLAFDRLTEALRDDVVIRYAWLPVGAAEYERIELSGLPAVQAWLGSRLAGRPDLRRFVSGFELLEWSASEAVGTVQMHERNMRITGTYRFRAARGPAGWKIRRLDLTEEIHH
jgi:SnoaL-like domain